MSLLTDHFNIQETTSTGYREKYPLQTPITKYFTLKVEDIDIRFLDSDITIIWNFDSEEFISKNLIEVITYNFKYAGVYHIQIFIQTPKDLIHLSKYITINDNYSLVSPSLEEGVFISDIEVKLESIDENALIYYTTDNSDPKESITSKLYTSDILITTSTPLKYYCILSDGTISDNYYKKYDIVDINENIEIFPSNPIISGLTEISFLYDTEYINCYYYINGIKDTLSLYTSPFTISENSIITYYSVSKTGLYFEEKSMYYYIDSTSPQIVSIPANGNYYNNIKFDIVTNIDNYFISYSLNNGAWYSYIDSSFDFVELMGLDYLIENTYNIPFSIRITDIFNNVVQYDRNYQLIIDNTPPSITFIEVPDILTTATSASFIVQINDVSVVWDLYVKIDDNPYNFVGSSNVINEINIPSLDYGYHIITFKVVDVSGNYSENTYEWQINEIIE